MSELQHYERYSTNELEDFLLLTNIHIRRNGLSDKLYRRVLINKLISFSALGDAIGDRGSLTARRFTRENPLTPLSILHD